MKIRVVHVITGLQQGGAEAMLVRLIKGLDRKEFGQSVISLTSRGIYGDLIEDSSVSLTTLGMSGYASMPGCLYKLGRLLRQNKPHIVQTWLYHADFLGLLAGFWMRDATVIWNIRCAELKPGDVPLSTRLMVRCLSRLSGFADAAIFNSHAGMLSHTAAGYRPKRSALIPNGFELDEWRLDPARRTRFRSEIGVSETALLVGMVARFHRMKDHSTFFAAAKRVRTSITNVRFVLVGRGMTWGNKPLVADIERVGLHDCVILLGTRSDMPMVMAGLDCLVLSSTSEGFPNVLGEAMASGIPCVTTDVGDARLIVGDSGYVVPVGDVDGITRGILAVLLANEQEKAALAFRCRTRITENFSIDRAVTRYTDFYRELYG